jgi:hypothetical protein
VLDVSHDHTDWWCGDPVPPDGKPCTLAGGPYGHDGPHEHDPPDAHACGCRLCVDDLVEAGLASHWSPPSSRWFTPPRPR